jgi:hypothetical protein
MTTGPVPAEVDPWSETAVSLERREIWGAELCWPDWFAVSQAPWLPATHPCTAAPCITWSMHTLQIIITYTCKALLKRPTVYNTSSITIKAIKLVSRCWAHDTRYV